MPPPVLDSVLEASEQSTEVPLQTQPRGHNCSGCCSPRFVEKGCKTGADGGALHWFESCRLLVYSRPMHVGWFGGVLALSFGT